MRVTVQEDLEGQA